MAQLKQVPDRLSAVPHRVAAPPKTADEIYRSSRWRTFIAKIKAARGAVCEDCGSDHRVAGDHIHELKDGGAAFDPKNIRLRCAACHNRKTAEVKAKRLGGR
ncbi:MAG: HNH endonuclease signature motif containing protein [Pseudomonadota bacterium]